MMNNLVKNATALSEYAPGVFILPYQITGIRYEEWDGTYTILISIYDGRETSVARLPTVYRTTEEAIAEVRRLIEYHRKVMTPIYEQFTTAFTGVFGKADPFN